MLVKTISDYLKLFYNLLGRDTIFLRRFSNGMGDNLLLTALLPELKNKYPNRKIIVESDKWTELFENNPFVDWVTDKHFKTTKRHIKPKYRITKNTKKSIHQQIAEYINFDHEVYPELYLKDDEIPPLNEKNHIVFCPSGKQGFSANRKEWGIVNFQEVINELSTKTLITQVGLESDPLLDKVYDRRHLDIRQTAGLIKKSTLFVGLEGGLMHLAKSVGTRSLIIYGGVIDPNISGYNENINVFNKVNCSPCFNSEKPLDDCLHKKCMEPITPELVIQKINNYLSNKENQ